MSLRQEDLLLNLGPQHPSTHGVFRMVLTLSGEKITDVIPHMGYLHRGFEKLAERRTVVQYQPYPDRWDYLAAMFDEMAYVGACEQLLNLEVPPRAEYLRAIAMELNRVASHLLWLGTFLLDVGALSPFLYTFREREMLLDLMMELTGARLTYNYLRIGGVHYDTPRDWLKKVAMGLPYFRKKLTEYRQLIEENPIFLRRVRGIGVLPQLVASRHGVTGPMLRASGTPHDLRLDRPYGAYRHVPVKVASTTNGDTLARYFVRVQEMFHALDLVAVFIDNMPEGPVQAKVPKTIKLPEGETYFGVEGPRGELGVFLVGSGGPSPYRLKIRPPSLFNLQVIRHLLIGATVSDAVAILGSVDIVLGEVDR